MEENLSRSGRPWMKFNATRTWLPFPRNWCVTLAALWRAGVTTGVNTLPAIATSYISETRFRRIYETFCVMEYTVFLVITNVSAMNGCFSVRAISFTGLPWTIIFANGLGTVFGHAFRGDGMWSVRIALIQVVSSLAWLDGMSRDRTLQVVVCLICHRCKHCCFTSLCDMVEVWFVLCRKESSAIYNGTVNCRLKHLQCSTIPCSCFAYMFGCCFTRTRWYALNVYVVEHM